jgi:hypothetical protein
MRLALAALALLLAFDAGAQSVERPRPPGTVPLEEPPPPPIITDGDPALQPQVTIRKEGTSTVHEYRVKGKLFMMRVVPPTGGAYVLYDNKGDGQFSRLDNNLDNGVRVPQWVLLEF